MYNHIKNNLHIKYHKTSSTLFVATLLLDFYKAMYVYEAERELIALENYTFVKDEYDF